MPASSWFGDGLVGGDLSFQSLGFFLCEMGLYHLPGGGLGGSKGLARQPWAGGGLSIGREDYFIPQLASAAPGSLPCWMLGHEGLKRGRRSRRLEMGTLRLGLRLREAV